MHRARGIIAVATAWNIFDRRRSVQNPFIDALPAAAPAPAR